MSRRVYSFSALISTKVPGVNTQVSRPYSFICQQVAAGMRHYLLWSGPSVFPAFLTTEAPKKGPSGGRGLEGLRDLWGKPLVRKLMVSIKGGEGN